MTSRPSLLNSIASIAACLALLSACGIPMQTTPEALTPPLAASASPESPQPAMSDPEGLTIDPSQGIKLWFVRSGELAPTMSALPPNSPAEQILMALFNGPESHGGLASDRTLGKDPTTGEPLLTSVSETSKGQDSIGDSPQSSIATVALSDAFFSLPSGDQSLLLGQAVMSLTSGGFLSVVFTDSLGGTLAVPLPNGRLVTGPVLRSDFDSLILSD